MRCSDRLRFFTGKPAGAWLLCAALFVTGSLALSPAAKAQAAPAALASASAPALSVTSTWSSLSKTQQTALAPLARHWDSLSEGQRRKWQAVAKTYPNLAVEDQEKLHSRMVEWAALSPRDRELARLNFARTKSVDKVDRAANWEAYQALSPDERKKLADGAKVKPVGAAVAVKPVAPDKLTAVPVTRHTPEPERAAAASQKPLNRNTLLPRQVPPTAVPVGASDSGPLTAPSKP